MERVSPPPATRVRKKAVAETLVPGAEKSVLAYLDRMDGAVLEGWAVDRAAPKEKLKLRVLIDGVIVDVISCRLAREHLAAFKLPSENVGFRYAIPRSYQDGGRHVLSFANLDGRPVTISTRSGMAMGELHFCLARESHADGMMDGLVDGLVQGWALNIDHRTNAKTGGVKILVMTNGQPLAELTADLFRADVAEALGGAGLRVCVFAAHRIAAWRAGDDLVLRDAGAGGVARQPGGDCVSGGFGTAADQCADRAGG